MVVFIIGVFIFLEVHIKEKEKENADLDFQIQRLQCGESFMVSDNTHHSLINRTEKILKRSSANEDSLTIGKSNYQFIGASYNWDGKFVWEVQKNDSSYFHILIENQDLGLNIAKCMTISLICE